MVQYCTVQLVPFSSAIVLYRQKSININSPNSSPALHCSCQLTVLAYHTTVNLFNFITALQDSTLHFKSIPHIHTD